MIELVQKFLEELRNMTPNRVIVPKTCAETMTTDRGDLNEKFQDLENDNENLNTLVKKLTKENKDIKNRLNEKKQKLSECICVLQKNENNIRNLSEDVNQIIKERDQYSQQNLDLKSQIQELEDELKEKTASFKSSTKERNLTICSQDLSSVCRNQLAAEEENSHLLSDTIKILTDENKSNLQIIEVLLNKMREVVDEKEEIEKALRHQNKKLKQDLEKYLNKNNRFSESIEAGNDFRHFLVIKKKVLYEYLSCG